MASRVTLRKSWNLAKDIQPTQREMRRLGTYVSTLVKERAFPGSGVGRDENGRPYKPYSTKRIYVSKKMPPRPADMPAPRGGSPMTRKTKRAAKSVRYDGGYSQYRASIGRSSGRNKNLFLTGQTARALQVLSATRSSVLLGFVRRRTRAIVLDEAYRFMGLTPEETAKAEAMLADIVGDRLNRG